MGYTLEVLNEVRAAIAANDDVLKEARDRRNLVTEASRSLGGTLRTFRSGSLAHGTVNAPVDDADSGVVLDRRSFPSLGPEGGGEGPDDVVEELQRIVGDKARETYPNARAGTSKRGLEVSFDQPIQEQDPTVDLIVTLTRSEGEGLWIPNLEKNSWDASHPEKHTELFTSGSRSLKAHRAHVIRLAKAWNCEFDRPALSSFNISALAWELITDTSLGLDHALAAWFSYAAAALAKGDTDDPAGVSPPIKLLAGRSTAVARLEEARDRILEALAHDDDEDTVRDALSRVFPSHVTAPSGSGARLASLLRSGNAGVSMTKAGIAVGSAGAAIKTTQAYGAEQCNG